MYTQLLEQTTAPDLYVENPVNLPNAHLTDNQQNSNKATQILSVKLLLSLIDR